MRVIQLKTVFVGKLVETFTVFGCPFTEYILEARRGKKVLLA